MRTCGGCGRAAAPDDVECAGCGLDLPTPLVGRLAAPDLPAALAVRFELLSTLGQGGMGIVYRVRDRHLGREVALKLLLGADALGSAALTREAVLLASLEHENVVRLYDAGIAGLAYLVMEYVRGDTLAQALHGGRPGLLAAVRQARDIAAGLAEAHRRGIVHRDLKPSNVFLTPDGRAKVADFGLAIPVAASAGVAAAGTPGYMAPEQSAGEPVGPASDVYALGLVLYEVLTGQRLFSGGSLAAVRERQSRGGAALLEGAPPMPVALRELVAAMLAPAPAARPGVDAVHAALAGWLERSARRVHGPDVVLPARPYKALAPFGPDDRALFFGRDSEIAELCELLEQPAIAGVVAFGPCGVGKSSLLRAGLLPALDPARFEALAVVSGADPASAMEAALAGARAFGRVRVLLVDQLEEVFTHGGPEGPRALFRLVERLAELPGRPVRLVLSLRTEFRGDLWPLEERLGGRLVPYRVREIGREGLAEAILGPARTGAYGFSFAPGLADRIAGEVLGSTARRGDAALPVMQILCAELVARRERAGRAVIDADLYAECGGPEGALARHVEERLAAPEMEARGDLARRMLQALTQGGDGGERFARPRPEAELLDAPDRAAARAVLERLVAERLVLRDEGPDGARQVRLVSEVVCPLVEAWAREPDDAERAARTLARAHRHWVEQGRRDEDLLAGGALALVARGALAGLEPGERELLERSLSARARQRRNRALASVASAALVAALGWFAFWRPGRLELRSQPPGAQVSLAGRKLGVTPFTWESSPGVYEVALDLPGYRSAALTVRVAPGGSALYEPVLGYLKGVLAVTSAPAGARCVMRPAHGPASVAVTPFTTELPAGTYALTAALEGYAPAVAQVELGPNRALTQQSLQLERSTGAVMIRSATPALQVTLTKPGAAHPALETTLPMPVPAELAEGTYVLAATRLNHRVDTQQVTVERGRTRFVSVWAPVVRTRLTVMGPPDARGLAGIGDVDGDGTPDVVLAAGGLFAYSGRTGQNLLSIERPGAPGGVWKPAPPALADLDGDGHEDLVAGGADGAVYAVSGKDGHVLWIAQSGGRDDSAASMADVDGDGVADAAINTSEGVIVLQGRDGRKLWERRMLGRLDAQPLWGDLNRDGTPDVVVAGEAGVVALAGDGGRVLWAATDLPGPHAASVLADVDGDGGLDVVEATATGTVRALDGRTGKVMWTRALGAALRAPLDAGDLDGDGAADVVAAPEDGTVRVLSGRTGVPLWSARLPAGALQATPASFAMSMGYHTNQANVGASTDPTTRPPPRPDGWRGWRHTRAPAAATVADVDGDGRLDVVAVSSDGVTHALSGRTGAVLWSAVMLGPAVAAPLVCDWTGDGVPECVLGLTDGHVVIAQPPAGPAIWSAELGSVMVIPPAVADLDGDGAPDAVAGCVDGRVTAISGRDGHELWSWRGAGALGAPLAIAELEAGHPDVIAAGENGTVVALAGATGRPRWTWTGSARVTPAPAIGRVDGDAVPDVAVGADDGTVHVLSGATGLPILTWSAGAPIQAAPLIVAGAVVVASTMGEVVSLRAGAADPVWRTRVTSGAVYLDPAAVEVDGEPLVVVAAADGDVIAVSGRTGAVRWRVRPAAECTASPVAGDLAGDGGREIVLGCGLSGVECRAARDGHLLWRHAMQLPINNRQLVLADLDGDGVADVLAPARDAGYRVINGRTGKLVSQGSLQGPTQTPVPLELDHRPTLLEVAQGSTLALMPRLPRKARSDRVSSVARARISARAAAPRE